MVHLQSRIVKIPNLPFHQRLRTNYGLIFVLCCALQSSILNVHLGERGQDREWYELEDTARIHHGDRGSGTAVAERWVRSVKDEALSRLILFGEQFLHYALPEYVAHYPEERPHQAKGYVVLFPGPSEGREGDSPIQCRKRLGGLLKYYHREAA
jgi:hypothetical protein